MANTKLVKIELDEPIGEGKDAIKEITLRRPTTSDLRELATGELLSMQVSAHLKLLPRICQPILTIDQIDVLALSDLLKIQGHIVRFFTKNGNFPMPQD